MMGIHVPRPNHRNPIQIPASNKTGIHRISVESTCPNTW